MQNVTKKNKIVVLSLLLPMAKITRDDKQVLGVVQIRRQELAIDGFLNLGQSADQDRDDRDVLHMVFKDLVDIGQVHLDAVLVLIRLERHFLEVSCLCQLRIDYKIRQKKSECDSQW